MDEYTNMTSLLPALSIIKHSPFSICLFCFSLYPCCTSTEVNHRNEIAFSLIDSTGALGTYVMLQYTDLALVPVVINAYVRIVDGSTGSDASAEYGKVEEIQPDRGTCRVRMSQHNYLKDVWLNHCAVCYQN